MRTFKEYALAYWDAGWSIFPLTPGEKTPHFDLLKRAGHVTRDGAGSWAPFALKHITREQTAAFWDQDPNANIGVACGRTSGITVIDIDVKNIPPEDFHDPEEIRFKVAPLTLTSFTGSGGMHLFCQYAAGIQNTTKRVHPQIDIKNDGGYIVLPPSIHPDTGLPYQFDQLTPWNTENVEALAPFPEELKQQVIKQEDDGVDWALVLRGVRQGIDGRNNMGAKLVGKLLHAIFLEFDYDQQFLPFIWEFLRWWNIKNKPPMSERELEHIMKSITKRSLYGE